MWMDTASVELNLNSSNEENHVTLYAVNDNCYLCGMKALFRENCDRESQDCTDLTPNNVYEFQFGTIYPYNIEIRSNGENSTVLWSTRIRFQDQANYTLQLIQLDQGLLQGNVVKVDDGVSNTLMIVILILLLLWPFGCLGLTSWRQKKNATSFQSMDQENQTPVETIPPQPIKKRIECLDVFRGIIIFTMIFVNLGGGGYWYFAHAAWNGLTIADIVFPFFAWIMGVTMNIGVASHIKKATPKFKILVDSLFRSIRLFLLGLFVNDFRNLKNGRIPGVLQSFAFGYFFVSLSVVAGLCGNSTPVLRRAVEGIIIVAAVLANLLIVFYLPVPNCPTGFLGPGGNGDNGLYTDCIGGAHLIVDKAIFGEDHVMQGGTSSGVYGTSGPWDPEGFLNWLMVAFTTYIGYIVGGLFLNEKDWVKKTVILITSGLVLTLLGLILCGFKINGGWIPINKNLWSLSFVLTSSGLACVGLGIMYLLVDKFSIWGGTPFKQNGMNAIALYVGHEILTDHMPFGWERDWASHTTKTISNLGGAICWTLVALWMHKNNIFITV